MRHEKIIKREDGTQYRILVNVSVSYMSSKPVMYDIGVDYRLKGKRSWVQLPDTIYDFQFRSLSMDARRIHTEKNMLRFLSKEEIYEAKLEAWQKLKPEL